jgi:hypothetical protein
MRVAPARTPTARPVRKPTSAFAKPVASPTPNWYTVASDICRQTSTSRRTPAPGASDVAAR